MNFAVNQVVVNRLAVIRPDFHKGGVLSGVPKDNRVLFIGEDIVLVGGKLLKIEAAERQIGFAYGAVVFIDRENFKQPVRRDSRAVRCGQCLGGKQAKGHGGQFAVCTDSE